MRRLGLLVGVLSLLVTAIAAAEGVRTFKLERRPIGEAVALVTPLLSSAGSIVIRPQDETLIVRDSEEALERISRVIAEWDSAPRDYRIHVELLHASRKAPPLPSTGGPQFSEEARAAMKATPPPYGPHFHTVNEALLQLFRFRFFSEISSLDITAADGTAAEMSVPGQYHLRFVVLADPAEPDHVRLAGLRLTRYDSQAATSEGHSPEPVLASTVSLRLGQTSIIGATKSEDANEAIVLVLRAEKSEGR